MPFAKASVYETLLVTIAFDFVLLIGSFGSSGTGASDLMPMGVANECSAASADDGTGVIGMNGRM